MLNEVKALKSFHEIDFHFAEFICKKEAPSEEYREELYSLVLCLSFYANLQHSVLPIKEVHGQSFAEFSQSEEESELKIDFSRWQDWLKIFPKSIGSAKEVKPLILDSEKGLLYLNKYYRAEEAIADFIRSKSEKFSLAPSTLEELDQLFPAEQCSYPVDWQKVAAFSALQNSFTVITGGPGTGKTTTVAKILTLLLKENPSLKIDLLAPTGKAADRLGESILNAKNKITAISQAIPEKASTIHRYLGYHGGTKSFKHNQQNKTSTELVLVDEASMVSLPLFYSLIKSLKTNCRVILLGDKDQLSAVETGNVLADLSNAEQINTFSPEFCQTYAKLSQQPFDFIAKGSTQLNDCVVKLENSYRFNEASGIGQLAKLVNDGEQQTHKPLLIELFEKYTDITLKTLPQNFIDEVKAQFFFQTYKQALNTSSPGEILTLLNHFRILCPQRSSKIGSEYLNEQISKEIFHKADQALYHGRCIMIRQNNKELGLYNGDVGVILNNEEELPKAYFPGGDAEIREFSPLILPEFETAFAMTIHKSQGSEYDEVMIPLPRHDSSFLSKELLYTGITRAKKAVILYSYVSQILQISQRKTKRYSGLEGRLQ